jgi:predicted RNA-binding protein with EMAP domain
MLSPADRIVDVTLPYTLRPQGNDREKVIAAALEFLIFEYSYTDFNYNEVIDVKDLQDLIDELKSTVTLEEPAQDLTTDSVNAL